jgi:Recombination, repair and ssDNA binding protein UvsY
MSTEDISEIWAQDSRLDETNLLQESKRIPELHSKYYNMYIKEALKVRKLKADYKELEHAKTEYYNGNMDEEELRERGWKPFRLKVIRQDLDKYIQADKDIINLSLKIDLYSARADYLEDIIKTIHSRNFIIKNMIDIIKFQHGEY